MPLPDDFSPSEHLQDVILLTQNKIVRAEFNDVGDDSWQRDISTARASLRTACTHLEADSIDMTQLRNWLFYVILRKCKDFHPAIFGIPSIDFQEKMIYFPQVQLYFEEKYSEADPNYDILRTQVSIRLVGETSQTFTVTEATALASKIKTLFNPGNVAFNFKRGKYLASYIDQVKGHHFQIYAFDETNAKKVIEQVLDIRGQTPDWKLLNLKANAEPTQSYPTIPTTKNILGKARKQPRKRPVGVVRFVYAVVHLYGMNTPLVLYNPDKRYTSSLVK
jgi:hypothetical protein